MHLMPIRMVWMVRITHIIRRLEIFVCLVKLLRHYQPLSPQQRSISPARLRIRPIRLLMTDRFFITLSIFQIFPDYHMTIEIKKTDRSMAAPFCNLIRQYHMQDKILVASFHDERMTEFRQVCPEVATSSARQETTVFVLMSKVFLGRLFSPSFISLQVPEESSDGEGQQRAGPHASEQSSRLSGRIRIGGRAAHEGHLSDP